MIIGDQMKICSSCGATNQSDAQACQACFQALRPKESPPNTPHNKKKAKKPSGFSLADIPQDASGGKAIAARVQQHTVEDPMIGEQVGNFVIKERIGKGGFGAVYRAEQIYIQESFAVKVLHVQQVTNEEIIKRFQREARALAQLQHDNIVKLSDFGMLPERGFYLVMEFLKGKSLLELLRARKRFPLPWILHIFEQLCRVLGYIHSLGIVHRDLKPGNIILTPGEDNSGKIKLIDFGIASLANDVDSITKTGTYLGTAQFASPEQSRGKKTLDGRSDLYSLSVILFRLLTGRLPFLGGNMVDVIYRQVNEPPPTLAEARPQKKWAEALEAFFISALAKNPSDRPQDALAYWKQCERALQEQYILTGTVVSEEGGSGAFQYLLDEKQNQGPHQGTPVGESLEELSSYYLESKDLLFDKESGLLQEISENASVEMVRSLSADVANRTPSQEFTEKTPVPFPSRSFSPAEGQPSPVPLVADPAATHALRAPASLAKPKGPKPIAEEQSPRFYGKAATDPTKPMLAAVVPSELPFPVSSPRPAPLPEQPPISLESEEDSFELSLQRRSQSKILFGGIGISVLVVLLLGGWFWSQSGKDLQVAPKTKRTHKRLLAQKGQPSKGKVSSSGAQTPNNKPGQRSGSAFKSSQVASAKPAKNKSQGHKQQNSTKTRMRKRYAKKRQLRTRRKRARYRWKKRRSSRQYAPQNNGPCGPDSTAYQWAVGKMKKPTSGRPKIRFFDCPFCQIKRKSGYICLSLPKAKASVKMRISLPGYQSCTFSLSRRRRKLWWTLKVEDTESIDVGSYRCTSFRP